MEKINIKIGEKTYKVKIALSQEEKEKGLQNIETLPENEGMLFVFNEEDQPVGMWMEDTLIPLDLIFIDEELTVIAVYKGEPLSKEIMSKDNTYFVLEVNQESGIKVGDELEFSPESKVKKDKMYVLDPDGKSQMELSGGERIFSRANTKTLIKFAKKASVTNNDNDYKALGKRVFKFITDQDNRSDEYVELNK